MSDLISKRTRNAFREEMVGWTLAEITTEFDNEGFSPDSDHIPNVGGQRRTLLEQFYRAIDFADPRDVARSLDLGDLVKAVSKQLKLLPDDVPNAAKGADAIKKTLRSLAATVSGLGEMRNYYGSGHGQDGRARGLTPRHARLAVGAASTLAMFLIETYEARGLASVHYGDTDIR